MFKTTMLAAAFAAMILSGACARSLQPSSEEVRKIQARTEGGTLPRFVADEARSRRSWTWTRQVYASRQFRPAWTSGGKIQPAAQSALLVLENARSEGLNPDDFGILDMRATQDPTEFDLHLTYALSRFASQLCSGRIDAKDIDPTWQEKPKTCDVPRIVGDAIDGNRVGSLPEQLAPGIPEYRTLKETLKTYRAKEPAPQDRIEQIEINMDRMRWLPGEFEPRHIRVNVPAFEMTVHDGSQIPLQSRVIVGADDNRTPLISGEMQYIVFSPYWNIPLSIATKELLPKIKKDPRYLDRQDMEVVRSSHGKVETIDPSTIDWDKQSEDFDYQLRQRPGASNALGLVKFIFPNPFNIYLHDTPADNLFARLTRTLSHGCIRVEKAAELAAYVLQDQPEWTAERINTAMHSGEERRVNLKTRLPVHIFYWTAWVNPSGEVQFSDDVYGYDTKHKMLTSPAPNAADIHVHEVGSRVVAHSAGLHR